MNFMVSNREDDQESEPDPPFQFEEGRKFWSFDAETRAEAWAEMVGSAMAFMSKRFKLLLDMSDLPKSHDEFLRVIRAEHSVKPLWAECAWNMANGISVGDYVLALSTHDVLGYGIVLGEYEYFVGDTIHPHRRDIEWVVIEPRQVVAVAPAWNGLEYRQANQPRYPVEITREMVLQALSKETTRALHSPYSNIDVDQLRKLAGMNTKAEEVFGEPEGESEPLESGGENADLKTIIGRYAANGLYYKDEQVAMFYTALQTKGFVVLSGISGTGKSKIATGFVEMLPAWADAAPIVSDTTGMISVTVKPYMRTYKRVILPARQVDLECLS